MGMKSIFFVCLILFSSSVLASGWTGMRDVERIGVRGDAAAGFYFNLSGAFRNPGNCQLTDHYYVRNTNPMYREMFSLILAAKKSNSQINVKVDGCDYGRPKVVWVVE